MCLLAVVGHTGFSIPVDEQHTSALISSLIDYVSSRAQSLLVEPLLYSFASGFFSRCPVDAYFRRVWDTSGLHIRRREEEERLLFSCQSCCEIQASVSGTNNYRP